MGTADSSTNRDLTAGLDVEILIDKISGKRHATHVLRDNGSRDRIELNSRSFLLHDFAHFAVETEVPLPSGYWGSVARGAALGGDIDGTEIWLAESLAGPVQTLMRKDAKTVEYERILEQLVPDLATNALAQRIHEHVRQLRGHWRGTPYGGRMRLRWEL